MMQKISPLLLGGALIAGAGISFYVFSRDETLPPVTSQDPGVSQPGASTGLHPAPGPGARPLIGSASPAPSGSGSPNPSSLGRTAAEFENEKRQIAGLQGSEKIVRTAGLIRKFGSEYPEETAELGRELLQDALTLGLRAGENGEEIVELSPEVYGAVVETLISLLPIDEHIATDFLKYEIVELDSTRQILNDVIASATLAGPDAAVAFVDSIVNDDLRPDVIRRYAEQLYQVDPQGGKDLIAKMAGNGYATKLWSTLERQAAQEAAQAEGSN